MATRIGGGEFITVTDHPPSSFSTEGRESELPFSVFFLLAAKATTDTSSVDAMFENIKKKILKRYLK